MPRRVQIMEKLKDRFSKMGLSQSGSKTTNPRGTKSVGSAKDDTQPNQATSTMPPEEPQGPQSLPHVESRWSVATGAWSEPSIVAHDEMRISVLSSVLQYGQQAFDGPKACRGPDGEIYLFRPDAYHARFTRSSALVAIPAMPYQHFLDCILKAVAKNAAKVPAADSDASLYIRVLAFGTSATFAAVAAQEYTFKVIVQPMASHTSGHPQNALVLEDDLEGAYRGPITARIGVNYAPAMPWLARARDQGYFLTMNFRRGSHEQVEGFWNLSFLGIRWDSNGNGCTVVANIDDVDEDTISSITVDSCLKLASEFGWRTERKIVEWGDLGNFDEVFAVGTQATIVQVGSVHRSMTDETIEFAKSGDAPGRIWSQLRTSLREIQHGYSPDRFSWNLKVS